MPTSPARAGTGKSQRKRRQPRQLHQELPLPLREINQLAMSRKQKKVMEVSPLESRMMSEETIELSEPSGSQEQEIQSQESPLSPQAKAYLDKIIQTTTTSLVQSMQQYMDQQFETINRRFAQLEQANISGSEGSSNTHGNTDQVTNIQHTQINNQEPMRVTSTRSNVDQNEGNYSPTPTLDRLIIEASTETHNHGKQKKTELSSTKGLRENSQL
ncbi:hypothetical protein C2G38_2204707 [Gigaspora rosea]|uniref:Uncharacterized protein n=1 Tax=Gigaspora rosea TaxID=44941 RepID=A0A397UNY7_9GLOM|nr:hypothetical protein C2G38_2204707 [Gigaspora rosea]